MIQMQTILSVADNTGARRISTISLRGSSARRSGSIGDIITAKAK